MTINWLFLIIGGLFETGFATSLGKAQESTGVVFWAWIATFVVSVSASMYLLYRAVGGENAIPIGTAYAVWGVIGAIGTVLVGIFWFKEPVSAWRIFFLTTLVISVVGLQIVSTKA